MKGEEGTMAARAICRNCEREMAIMQDGMCGGCFGRVKGLEGSEKLIALAKARTDFKGKGPVSRGNRAPRVKRFTAKPPRKAKVEATAQKDPANGAIESSCSADIDPKMEGAATRPDISGADSIRKPDRNPGGDLADYIESEQILARLTAMASKFEPAPPISIIINFHDQDMPLFASLQDVARKFRRSPDQQILWMLQHGLDYLDDFLARHPEVSMGKFRGEEVARG
jgi:hypothetical protein